MFINLLHRRSREKARRSLLENDLFTESQTEAIMEAFETAHKQSLKRLALWTCYRTRLNAVPVDCYSEREAKARLIEKLTRVGLTEQQSAGIVWASWYSSGVGIYEPGELFTEGRRVLPSDRQVTDKHLLCVLSGSFERASTKRYGRAYGWRMRNSWTRQERKWIGREARARLDGASTRMDGLSGPSGISWGRV